MIYLDANALFASVALVNQHNQTELMARLLRQKELCYASALTDYETRKALIEQKADDAHFERLEQLITERVKLNHGWEAAVTQALKMARQFKDRLWVDSADTLHVGWALALGVDTFASFDRNSGPRALALAVGMKLYPKPEPRDYEQMKRLKG